MAKCELCDGVKCECEKEIKVSFCPKCKSQDVKYIFELKNAFGMLPKMRCGKCENEAATFPLLVTSKKALAASAKSKTKVKKKGAKK